MPKVSNKLIWGLPICIVVYIVLVFGFIFGYKYYLFRNAKADLFSCDEKRMGPAFAYLLKQGDKGLKIIEDFCRQNTSAQWGKTEGGLRIKIEVKQYISKVKTLKRDDSKIFSLLIQNVTDNSIETSRPSTIHLPIYRKHHFPIFKNEIKGSVFAGSSTSIICILKPRETIKIDFGLKDLVWFKEDLGMFYDAFFKPHLMRDFQYTGLEPRSNPVTFVILP